MSSLAQTDFEIGTWRVHPALHQVSDEGGAVHLEPKVMAVLVCLAERAGEVVSKEEVMRTVWPDAFVTDQVLTHAVWQLRQALGSSGEPSHIIETISKKGYRLTCPVITALSERDRSSGVPGRRPSWRMLLGSAAALAVLVVLGYAVLGRSRGAPPNALAGSVAVLPLANLTGDPQQDFLCDGVTEDLTTGLARIDPLRVVSRTSSMRYRGTGKPLSEIARELAVDAVIEGAVRRSDDRIRITVQLVQTSTDRHLWANTYEGALRDVVTLQAQATRDIAFQLRFEVKPEDDARLRRTRQVDGAAYEAYQKGRRAARVWDRPRLLEAAEYFEQAVEMDPQYAEAYAQLAHAYGMLNFAQAVAPDDNAKKFRTFTQKALDLDPDLSDAHVNLGDIRFYGDWDWSAGQAEFRRAVELDPGSVDAQEHYATCLWVLARYDAAGQELRRALQFDPLSARLNVEFGAFLRDRGDLAGAMRQYTKAIDLEPGYVAAFANLGAVYEELGRHQEAMTAYLRAASLSGDEPDTIERLNRAFETSGIRGYWTERLRQLQGQARRRTTSSLASASIYVHLRRDDDAMDFLERAYRQHLPALTWINARREWAPLRSNPRFQTLLRRMRFP